jgi:hypothetical protein
MIGALLESSSFSLQSLANALAPLVPPGFQEGLNPLYFWLAVALIAAILNIILSQMKQFEKAEYKAARGIISLILAWFAASVPVVSHIILSLSQGLGIVIVAIFAILIIAALSGYQGGSKFALILLLLGVAVFLIYGGTAMSIFSKAGSVVGYVPNIQIPPTVIAAIVILILIVLFIWGTGGKKGASGGGGGAPKGA